MKNRLLRSLDNLIIAVLSAALLTLGAIEIANKPEQKIYRDQYMSFVFPGDYRAIPTTYGGLTIVEIKNNDKKFAEVARIELADDNNGTLKSILEASYSDFSAKQVKKIYKTSEGYQFTETTANESIIYTYIKSGNSIFMIKFYESYYKSDNALVRVSNSLLLKDLYNLINSFGVN